MGSTESPTLVKLSETDQQLASPEEDIRGRHVKDRDGQDLGRAHDLLIDEDAGKVRFVEVASGGFLGIGQDTTFIPVDAITAITTDEVRINQDRGFVAGAPTYDPEIVTQPDYLVGTLGYYGYGPFWAPGYLYPNYPHYR
ncbi:PRC-barrel domain-containing protein [Herbiconiux sp. VKM Ac-2851]|uniref:PRC-barrel domain-containing protein n=1 Tax=Herbiconiux sp. VKM Ac-2851 TaxID=2739025 RepID=UPI0015654391|nr:PRC-barrel domain-containing protein [Herbiconiux sp. VKM Ac-2851]NQX37167.1 PRC-barrel domain-containing protein [Herbiconiux sp. VKM Ac-2851]